MQCTPKVGTPSSTRPLTRHTLRVSRFALCPLVTQCAVARMCFATDCPFDTKSPPLHQDLPATAVSKLRCNNSFDRRQRPAISCEPVRDISGVYLKPPCISGKYAPVLSSDAITLLPNAIDVELFFWDKPAESRIWIKPKAKDKIKFFIAYLLEAKTIEIPSHRKLHANTLSGNFKGQAVTCYWCRNRAND
jgi:hypothetical protein